MLWVRTFFESEQWEPLSHYDATEQIKVQLSRVSQHILMQELFTRTSYDVGYWFSKWGPGNPRCPWSTWAELLFPLSRHHYIINNAATIDLNLACIHIHIMHGDNGLIVRKAFCTSFDLHHFKRNSSASSFLKLVATNNLIGLTDVMSRTQPLLIQGVLLGC